VNRQENVGLSCISVCSNGVVMICLGGIVWNWCWQVACYGMVENFGRELPW